MKILATAVLGCVALPIAAHADINVYAETVEKPVKDREGVASLNQFARLSNGRLLYELEFGANTGAPLQFAPDKQIETTRRPYQNYTKANTPDRNGFASLGLAPTGNWDDFGFFNFYINDVGLEYIAPTMEKTEGAGQVTTKFVWQNSQAKITQTFVLRRNDDKLLMRLDVAPNAGVKIERMVLQLRNTPREANGSYNNPASLASVLTTAAGTTEKAGRVEIPLAQPWAAFSNKDLGAGASGVLFVPDETQKAFVLLGEKVSRTTIFLKPELRSFHFSLWEVPHLENAAFISYLQAATPALRDELAQLGKRDWNAPLPAAPADSPLHLTDAIYKPSADETRRGYIVAPSHPLQYVDWNSLPASSLNELNLRAAPNTTEQAAFGIYTLKDLGKTTLEWSDLTGAGGTIAASQMDARIVKVWPQQTGVRGGSNGEHLMTPELLVRNDTLPLTQAWTGENTYRPTEKGATGFITGPVIAELPRDIMRQFWLMVRVPASAKAGTYRGTISVAPAQGEKFSLPISLEVLPIQLTSPDKRYTLGIYYRGKIGTDNDNFTENMSPARMKRELEDIKDHGFTAPSLFASKDPQTVAQALKIYREVGLTGPVGIEGGLYAYNNKFDEKTNAAHREGVQSYLKLFQDNKVKGFFFGIDEPRGDKIEINKKRAEITRGVKLGDLQGRYATAASGGEMKKLVGDLDYPIVSSYFASRKEMQELRDDFHKTAATPLYYWQIWGEYPQGSRLNSGYFLYESGYDGVYPYAYRHFSHDPYMEGQDEKGGFKNILASYPSNEGPISTLQWEGARAGIVDLSYLVTLDELLTKAGNAAKADRENLDEVLKKYGYGESDNWGRMIYGALNWPEHQTTVAPQQFDADRRVVADLIAKYQAKGTNN